MRRTAKDGIVLSMLLYSYYYFVYWLYGIFPQFTFWCLFMPYVTTSFLFMFGNFSQHMFVNPDSPDCNYNLAYICIGEGANNDKIFNDGYHIVHHEHSKLHWTKMADEFGDNWEEFLEKGAIVFRGIDNMMVGIMIFTGQIEKLVKNHYVGLDENILETLKHRMKPIHESKPTF